MFQDNQTKPLSKMAVRSAAVQLMERNYTTTNLEIKLFLRTQNFWAIQSTISRWMDELAEEENWFFISNNYHRNYFKNEIVANYFLGMSEEEMSHFLSNIKFSVN